MSLSLSLITAAAAKLTGHSAAAASCKSKCSAVVC